jgi:hypothetical protein
MPFTYTVSASDEQAYVTGRGKVTTSEAIKTLRTLLADPHFEPSFSVIVDVRDITYAPPDQSEIIRVAKAIEDVVSTDTGNIAVVAKGALLFTAVLLATHVRTAKSINIKVFADPESARAFCIQGRLVSLSPASN